MKKLLLSLFLLLGMLSYGQTIYSWVPNVNPGWVSNSNITGNLSRVLNYQPNLGYVSSNDIPAGNRYVNGQRTSYTSPIINTSCTNASTIIISFNIDADLENRYDWGYFQYSINGGTTWVNPVQVNSQNNPSGVDLGAFNPLTNWVSNNNNPNRRGWTGSVSNVYSYTIVSSTTTRFRFIFASDNNVNSYSVGPWWSLTTYDNFFDVYNFKIVCNVALPIELESFEGYNTNSNNNLIWSTSSEQNNDYFTIERSINGINWVIVNTIKGNGNSTSTIEYSLVDNSYDNVINYYQLKQTDYDGKFELFEKMVVIDNRIMKKKIIKTVNLLGQEVDENYGGVVIEIYEDNTTSKKLQ